MHGHYSFSREIENNSSSGFNLHILIFDIITHFNFIYYGINPKSVLKCRPLSMQCMSLMILYDKSVIKLLYHYQDGYKKLKHD